MGRTRRAPYSAVLHQKEATLPAVANTFTFYHLEVEFAPLRGRFDSFPAPPIPYPVKTLVPLTLVLS